jgi:hypothetical protein
MFGLPNESMIAIVAPCPSLPPVQRAQVVGVLHRSRRKAVPTNRVALSLGGRRRAARQELVITPPPSWSCRAAQPA